MTETSKLSAFVFFFCLASADLCENLLMKDYLANGFTPADVKIFDVGHHALARIKSVSYKNNDYNLVPSLTGISY